MKGDKLYCIECGNYSIDVQNFYDSRNNGKPKYDAPKKVHFVWNCPYCGSNKIMNVNQTMIDNIIIINKKKNNYKGSTLYKKFKKDWPLLQQKTLNSLSASILLEETDND